MLPLPDTSTIADLRRASEIVGAIVKHGFGHVFGASVVAIAPQSATAIANATSKQQPYTERVRRLFEELGPTFVKLGQILSTRADIIPHDLATALATLQDAAEPLPFETVAAVLEAELGEPVHQRFECFAREPLASASIAQAHRAVLARDGQRVEVVVKVQRPGIAEKIRSDLNILRWLARVFEGTIEEASAYTPTLVVEQFERALEQELDFQHELANIERFRKNFATRSDLIAIPEPIADSSTARVLTMSFLNGVKLTSNRAAPDASSEALRDRLVEATYLSILEHGFFHGDPHPGNLLVLPDGRFGLLDFGLCGRLTTEQQDALLDVLSAIVLKSPRTLARLTLRGGLGEVGPDFDRTAYERDVGRIMDKYVGVELSTVAGASLLADLAELVRRHRIKLPTDLAILARALATLDGVMRSLSPKFDLQAIARPYIWRFVAHRLDLNQAGPAAMSLVLGLRGFAQQVPGQIDQLLLDMSNGRFRVAVQGAVLESFVGANRKQGLRSILAMLAGAFAIAAALLVEPASSGHALTPLALAAFVAAAAMLALLMLTFVFPNGPRKLRIARRSNYSEEP